MQRPRLRTGRAIVLGVSAAALALGASACSTIQKAQSVAVVEGQPIYTDAVAEATTQYNHYLATPGDATTQITQAQMVGQLIQAHFVNGWLASHGGFKPDAQYASLLAKIPDAAPSTIDFLESAVALQSGAVTDAGKTDILATVKTAKVEVSPRYGTFNPETLALSTTVAPNWIKASAAGSNAEPAPAQ